MQHEYEAKFLRVDPTVVRQRLEELGAVLVCPERLMRRKTFDFADHHLKDVGAWVRVRDEGDKVTMSYKQVTEQTMEGMKEEMIVVDDFARACAFLESTGFVQTSFQENRRETWRLNGCEVVIDWWPWILPLVEIEGLNEDIIRIVSDKLGFDWTKKLHGGIEPAYEDGYMISGTDIASISSLTFDERPTVFMNSKM